MLSIGWYARDGHLDVFPSVSLKLKELGLSFEAHYACHNPLEAGRLQETYGIANPWVLGPYLRLRRPGRDISRERLAEMGRRYGADIPLIRCGWGDLFEKNLREPEFTHNIVGLIEFWEDFLLTNRIDVLVIEVPSIASTCVAWLVCQQLGVEFLSFVDIAPLGDRILVTSSWCAHYDEFQRAFSGEEPVTDEDRALATAYLERMRTRPQTTLASRRRMTLREYERIPVDLGRHLLAIPAFLRRERARREFYVHSSGLDWLRRWALSYLHLRKHRLINVFDPPEGRPDEDFVLVPLHQRGEWSNYTWMGLGYSDQLETIRHISACLPLGWKLYVKEHTAGFGERPLSFYRRLRALRGVRVIGPHEDSFALVKASRGIVTLGSSMGWEAMLLGKPVILLAEPWYVRCRGVYLARTAEALARLLLDLPDLPAATDDEKLRFVEALFHISFEGYKYPHERTLSSDNLTRWAQALRRRIEVSLGFRQTTPGRLCPSAGQTR